MAPKKNAQLTSPTRRRGRPPGSPNRITVIKNPPTARQAALAKNVASNAEKRARTRAIIVEKEVQAVFNHPTFYFGNFID